MTVIWTKIMTVVPTTTSASKPGSEDEDDMDDEEFEMDISLREQARERSTGTDNAVDVSARSGRDSTFSDKEGTRGHVFIRNNANTVMESAARKMTRKGTKRIPKLLSHPTSRQFKVWWIRLSIGSCL